MSTETLIEPPVSELGQDQTPENTEAKSADYQLDLAAWSVVAEAIKSSMSYLPQKEQTSEQPQAITIDVGEYDHLSSIMKNPDAVEKMKSRIADIMEHGGSSPYTKDLAPVTAVHSEDENPKIITESVAALKNKVNKIEATYLGNTVELWNS